MGMFDNINCEFPLGSPELQNLDYQTKDLDCGMAVYKIDEKGRLWLNHRDGEYDPYSPEEIAKMEAERTPGFTRIFLDFDISRGKYRETLNEWLPQDNITSTIDFYTNVEDESLKYPDNWVEFQAVFLYGHMQSLKVLSMPKRLQETVPLGPIAMPCVSGTLEIRYNGKIVGSCDLVSEPKNDFELASALQVMLAKLNKPDADES